MNNKIIFTGRHNSVYEGISFENGVFVTSDPGKIARLRASAFYATGEISEVSLDDVAVDTQLDEPGETPVPAKAHNPKPKGKKK